MPLAKPAPFNRNITANKLASLLKAEGIAVVRVTSDMFDEVDDSIDLPHGADVQVGAGYVCFNYWKKEDGDDVMVSKDVKNLPELLDAIRAHIATLPA